MKRIFLTITVFAVCYVTNVNASNNIDVITSQANIELTKSITSHPDFTDAELRVVLNDIAEQIGYTYDEVLSLYEQDRVQIQRPENHIYTAVVHKFDGTAEQLAGDIF